MHSGHLDQCGKQWQKETDVQAQRVGNDLNNTSFLDDTGSLWRWKITYALWKALVETYVAADRRSMHPLTALTLHETDREYYKYI